MFGKKCSKEDADSPSGTGEWTDSIATSMIDHCDKVRSSKTNHNNNQLNPSRRRKEVKLLVISNHQETADVPLMFQMFTGYPQNVLLWVMDAMFKHTHFGWVSWIHGDYFIKPGAFESNHLTKHCLENMDKNTIILFPEGGFRYKKAASSKRYSEKMNLPCLKNLVWPRFGAFQDLIDKRIGITHFMDVTIIYPNIQKPFTMIDVLLGVDSYTPVYMIYRVYDLQDIEPTNEWLNELWKQKDEMISSFYEDPERVLQKYPLIRRVELNWRQLWMVNVVYFTMAAFYVYVIRCLWSLAF